MSYRRLWIALALVLVISFAVLGGVGIKILNNAPPVPADVVTTDGRVLFNGEFIRDGQNVWQSIGGQEVGTVWGHGAYVAPDWSADWLHRECTFILDRWARDGGAVNYSSLGPEQQAALQARLQHLMRRNTYDPVASRIVLDPVRAEAFEGLATYYADIFSSGRSDYAIPKNALNDPAKLRRMSAFFWWTSWAASTERPGTDVTYTQNWPHEPLIGNQPTGGTVVWSVVSFVLLLAGIGGMVWYFASQERTVEHEFLPERDPLLGLNPTPSQRATVKYFFVVAALWVVQVGLGAVTAHYGVEGWVLWHSAGQMASLRSHPDLALANRHLLDCDFLAGDRTLRCSRRQRSRTQRSAVRSECIVRCPAARGGRITGRRVDGNSAKAAKLLVLVWFPRLRVRGTSGGCGKSSCSWDWFSGYG